MAGNIVLFLAEADVRQLFGEQADVVIAAWHRSVAKKEVDGRQIYNVAMSLADRTAFRRSNAVLIQPTIEVFVVTCSVNDDDDAWPVEGLGVPPGMFSGLRTDLPEQLPYRAIVGIVDSIYTIPADWELLELEGTDEGATIIYDEDTLSPPPMLGVAVVDFDTPLGTPAMPEQADLLALSIAELDGILGMTPALKKAALALGRAAEVQAGLLSGKAVMGRRLFGTLTANATVAASRIEMAPGSSEGPPSSPMATALRSAAAADALDEPVAPEIQVDGVAVLPVRRRDAAIRDAAIDEGFTGSMSDAQVVALVDDPIWSALRISPPTPLMQRRSTISEREPARSSLALQPQMYSEAVMLGGEPPPLAISAPTGDIGAALLVGDLGYGAGVGDAAAGTDAGGSGVPSTMRHRRVAGSTVTADDRINWLEQRVDALDGGGTSAAADNEVDPSTPLRYESIAPGSDAAAEFVRTGEGVDYQQPGAFPSPFDWLSGYEAALAAYRQEGVRGLFRSMALFHERRPSHLFLRGFYAAIAAVLCTMIAFLPRRETRQLTAGPRITLPDEREFVHHLAKSGEQFVTGVDQAVALPPGAATAGVEHMQGMGTVLRSYREVLGNVTAALDRLRLSEQAREVNPLLAFLGQVLLGYLRPDVGLEWAFTVIAYGFILYSLTAVVMGTYRLGQWCRDRGEWQRVAQRGDAEQPGEGVGSGAAGVAESQLETAAVIDNPFFESPGPATLGEIGRDDDPLASPGRGGGERAPLLERGVDEPRRGGRGRRRWWQIGRGRDASSHRTSMTRRAGDSSGGSTPDTSHASRLGASADLDTVFPGGGSEHESYVGGAVQPLRAAASLVAVPATRGGPLGGASGEHPGSIADTIIPDADADAETAGARRGPTPDV